VSNTFDTERFAAPARMIEIITPITHASLQDVPDSEHHILLTSHHLIDSPKHGRKLKKQRRALLCCNTSKRNLGP